MANNRSIVSGWDTSASRPKGVTSAADMRASLAMVADRPGIALEERAAEVSLSPTSMALSWTAFNAVIPAPGGGWYTPRVGASSMALAVGDPTYPRIDVIWVKQHDFQSDATHPDSEVEVGVSRGVPSATPATPAPPVGALAVFTVRVPKAATRGTDVTAAGVTRAPWSAAPQPKALPTGFDVTSRLTLVDPAGWLLAGGWFARLEGKVVTLRIRVNGPWGAVSAWTEKNLLSIDPSIAPYSPGGVGTVMASLPTSAPETGGAYVIAYADRVALGIKGSTTWTGHDLCLSWIIK